MGTEHVMSPVAKPKLTMLERWGLLSRQRGPCPFLCPERERRKWARPSHRDPHRHPPPWAFPHKPGPAEKGKGAGGRGPFPAGGGVGFFLFSLLNRKQALEKAESAAL